MLATSIILIATGIINLALAWIIFGRGRRQRANLFYSLLTLSIAGWAFSMYLFRISDSLPYIMLWGRVVYVFAGAVPFFFLLFATFFPNSKRAANYFLIIPVTLVLVVSTLASMWGSYIISDAVIIDGVNSLNYGWGNIFYGAYVLLFFLWGFILLLTRFRGSSGIVRSQLKLIIVGAALTLLISFFNNVILTFLGDFKYNWIGPSSTLIMVGFIGYAISRYRLMDIRSIIKKSSVFALLVVIIGASLVLLSTLITKIFESFFYDGLNLVSIFLTAIVITIFFQPLKSLLEKITNKFLFIRTYNSSEVLLKTNEIISSTIDLQKLLRLVSDNLNNTFHYAKIGFALIDKSNNKTQLKVYYQDGFDEKVLEQFSHDKIKVLPWYFSGSKEIKVIDELKAQYEAGEYQPKSVELLYGLYELNISLVIPLFAQDDLIGLIILGGKKSGDPYTGEDLKVLNIISGQLGISIENARLYEKQKDFNLHLKDEVKKATAKLEAANAELQRLDDAKSEFLSIASHQLRTPLTITKGYVSMMQEGSFGKVPKIIMENLTKVYTANERLLNLVENLLDISRIEAGRLEFNLEPVDLVETTRALIVDFQAKAKAKKLKLEFFPDPKMPKCRADAQKVKEVISNLIDNSIKYTNKGEITVGIHQESQSLVFSCQDTGMGIESEDLPRLFNKFVRGKGMMTVHTEGTGLGLYFARVVIENMGGRIWAESPGKNRGSKFTFSLPLADKKKAQKVKVEQKSR